MTLRKLSDADKQEILDLYRVPEETTSTIAAQYDVSPTTISRILRAGMSDDEYELLAQQKRGQHLQSDRDPSLSRVESSNLGFVDHGSGREESIRSDLGAHQHRRRRRRSSAEASVSSSPAGLEAESEDKVVTSDDQGSDDEVNRFLSSDKLPSKDKSDQDQDVPSLGDEGDFSTDWNPKESYTAHSSRPILRKRLDQCSASDSSELEQLDGDLLEEEEPVDLEIHDQELAEDDFSDPDFGSDEDLVDDLDQDDQLDDGLDEDDEILDDLEAADDLDDADPDDVDDDDLDDVDDDLDDSDLDDLDFAGGREGHDFVVEVLPLTKADIPEPFYLVVDHVSELVTRPLRDFRDLGQLPSVHHEERTLPVFGNHRVARRFCRKSHRIIKVADGGLLQIVTPYLQARGITRLLIDGHLYSI